MAKKKTSKGKVIIWSILFLIITLACFYFPVRERMETGKSVLQSNSKQIYDAAQDLLSIVQNDPRGKFTIQTRIHDEIIHENSPKLQGMPTMSGLASENAPIFNIWSHENFAASKRSIKLVGGHYLMTDKDYDVSFADSEPIAATDLLKIYKIENEHLYFEPLKLKPMLVITDSYLSMVDLNKTWFESYKRREIPFFIFSNRFESIPIDKLSGIIYMKARLTPEDAQIIDDLKSKLQIITQHHIPGTTVFAPISGTELMMLPIMEREGTCLKLSEEETEINQFRLQISCIEDSFVTFKQAYHTNWKGTLEDGETLIPYRISPYMNAYLIPKGTHALSVLYTHSGLENLTTLISLLTLLISIVIVGFWIKHK